ncbi:hypothetical protein [Micromonospora sp. NPDC005173]|uniref:hypothetical protein n=1 Tax=Micromonospora sp. NPDC005173 TaxID=3157165 RepID=UPI00339EA332
MATLVDVAREIARHKLEAPLPRRWSHVRAVAAKAQAVSEAVAPEDRDVLVASAWLHDMGYSADLVDTGFHSLDGGGCGGGNGSTTGSPAWSPSTRVPGWKRKSADWVTSWSPTSLGKGRRSLVPGASRI